MKHLLLILLLCFTGCAKQPSELDRQIGQMIMVGFRGLTIAESKTIKRDIEQHYIGSIVLFDYDVPSKTAVRNIQSAEQVKQLTTALQNLSETKLIISIDQEGGKVRRLKEKFSFPKTVSAQYLGDLNNRDSTYYYATIMAQTLRNLGINMNLAPVVDLNINPNNPVIGGIERSFSENHRIVSQQAKYFIKAHHDNKVLTALKHFPGHGSSETDSHLGLVDVTKTWSKIELEPYQFLIDSGYADAIMTAHVFNNTIDTSDPATLSKQAITNLLRHQLKWNGVIISDDMMMGAITEHYGLKSAILKAINAGVDILAFANNTSEFDPNITVKAAHIIHELIDEGSVSKERINQSYQRIIKLKTRL